MALGWMPEVSFRLAVQPVDDDLTRRGFLAGMSSVALAGSAAACSGRGDEAGRAASPGTRVVETDRGPVSVPAAPERVACADFFGAFTVVDLGLIPVGVSGSGYENTGGEYPRKLDGIPAVGDFLEPNAERIAATQPDLILRTIDTDDELYDELSAVAPTVVISFQQLSLPEVALRVGDAIDRIDEAEALDARYRERCDDIATGFADVLSGRRFAYLSTAADGTWWTLGPAWTDTRVLVDAGVRLAEPSATQADPTQEYALEQLEILEPADVLLIPAGPDMVTSAPENTMVTDTPLWATLPAVRAGRVYAIPYGAASIGTAFMLQDRLRDVLSDLRAEG